MAYETFQTRREELYGLLEAAEHSVSYAAHLMELDGSTPNIDTYFSALDYAASIRGQIGENGDAESAQREKDAMIVRSPSANRAEKDHTFDLGFVINRQNKRALGQ